MKRQSNQSEKLQKALLAWFDRHARNLPWRKKGVRDPYRVWLSEIMLQQTTVSAVIPYFEKFLAHFPNLETLAAAPLEDVLKHWAGLGYYSRARNLHKCARVLVSDFEGRFPKTETELLKLPGIGPYSAAAILALAFGRKAVVVDGNIERVLSRLFNIETPLPKSKPQLKALAGDLTPDERPGDYAEALMDLGALVCKPKAPDCPLCPLLEFCEGEKAGIAPGLPRREVKKPRPVRTGTVYWLEHKGKVLTRRRPETGLLGGMVEFPTTPWREKAPDPARHQPADIVWEKKGEVTHTFTHFHLVLDVVQGRGEGGPGVWIKKTDVLDLGLPTVMKKVAEKVLKES